MSGKLISIEGGEGAGKSTVIASLVAALEQRGLRVQTAREPGGTALGEAVRELVLARISHHPSAADADPLAVTGRTPSGRLDVVSATPAPSFSPCAPSQRRLDALATKCDEKCGPGPVHHAICAEAELLLMFASRAQLVRERVLPALAAGDWVVSDRFTDASFAYQGAGRGIDCACIAELERWAVGLKPDLTFLLDVGVDIGMQRVRGRGGEPDRIESETTSFFERARACYRQRAAAEPARYRVIDAGQPVAAVVAAVQQALQAWLDQRP